MFRRSLSKHPTFKLVAFRIYNRTFQYHTHNLLSAAFRRRSIQRHHSLCSFQLVACGKIFQYSIYAHNSTFLSLCF